MFLSAKQRAAREAALRAFRSPNDLGSEARRVLATMRLVLEGVRAGLPLGTAAARARLSSKRLGLWRELSAEGHEPFASFVRELPAQRAEADFEIATNLRSLAQVDARASMALGAFEDRLERRARSDRGEAPEADDESAAEAWRALLAPPTDTPALPAGEVVAVAHFEPRRRNRR